jgi:hypothetical protein
VLGPLARVKHELSSFVQQANTTSMASAARATDIARSFHLLPAFLSELRPLEADLGTLADQATPVFNTLNQAAPSINSQWQQLAPFAQATRTSLIALGRSAAEQEPALLASIPLAYRLQRLGQATAPAATLLDRLLSSLKTTGGIQQLMKLLLNGTGATNGVDAVGHYIRTFAVVSGCTAYNKVAGSVPGCSANFSNSGSAAATDETALRSAEHQAAMRAVRRTGSNARSRVLSGLLHYLLGGSQ